MCNNVFFFNVYLFVFNTGSKRTNEIQHCFALTVTKIIAGVGFVLPTVHIDVHHSSYVCVA